jgi:polysaccharide biosynthesis transport protein
MANPISNSGVSNSGFLAEPDLGYGQLFGVLVRRRWWLISGLLLGLLLGGVAGYRDQKIYTSSLQLLVEPNYRSRNPAEPGATQTDTQVGVDVGTQIQLLQTGKIIQRVMKTLQPQYPDLNPADPRGVNNFRRSLKVAQVASGDKEKSVTKIFQVAYTDNDPYKAKAIVEALQKVYQEENLQQQRDRLNKGMEFVNRALPETMQKVKSAESLLQQFRLDQQTIDPVSQAAALEALITKITQEEQVSRSQLQELQTRYYDLQQRVGLSPQQALLASRLTQSSRYQSYLNEIQKTELSLA